jgi:hypothetical protein
VLTASATADSAPGGGYQHHHFLSTALEPTSKLTLYAPPPPDPLLSFSFQNL